MFFVQTRYCLSSRSRGGILLLCASDRVSLSYMRRRQTSSLYRGVRVSMLYSVVADSFSIYRRENRGESASLLDREEADSFFVQGGASVSLLDRGVRLLFYPLDSIESVSLLYVEETVFFFVHWRECLSSRYRGGRLLLYTEERVSLFYM